MRTMMMMTVAAAAVSGFRLHRPLPSTNITWHYEPTSALTTKSVLATIDLAFDAWSMTGLRFYRVTKVEGAMLRLSFQRRNHGDGFDFDGRGYILAHAFTPSDSDPRSGDIHFDVDEYYYTVDDVVRIDNRYGVDLYSVALHEIGHALGLDHSSVRSSIMYPSYEMHKPKDRLHIDDLNAIRQLYFKNVKFWAPTATSTPAYPKSCSCVLEYGDLVRDRYIEDRRDRAYCSGRITSINVMNGEFYVIIDSTIWRYRDNGSLYRDYPGLAEDMWPMGVVGLSYKITSMFDMSATNEVGVVINEVRVQVMDASMRRVKRTVHAPWFSYMTPFAVGESLYASLRSSGVVIPLQQNTLRPRRSWRRRKNVRDPITSVIYHPVERRLYAFYAQSNRVVGVTMMWGRLVNNSYSRRINETWTTCKLQQTA